MTTIVTKNGSGAPLASDLVQGELAVDLTNKRLYTEDSGGTVIELGSNPTSLTTGTFTSTGIDDNATSTAITIDASENVGIGTTSPERELEISRTGGARLRLTRDDTTVISGNPIGSIEFYHKDADDEGIAAQISSEGEGSAGGANLLFSTGTPSALVEAAVITSDGNVGIGTTSPSGVAGTILELSSSGSTRLNISASDSSFSAVDFSDTSADGSGRIEYYHIIDMMRFYTNNNERMRIDSSGNVGIGTSSPSRLLTLSGTGATILSLVSTDDDNCQLMFGDSASDTVGKILYRHSGNSMAFETNAAEAMRIDSSGRVGIGTSDPSSGTSTYYDDLVIKNATSGTGAGITIQSNTTNGFGAVEFRKADGTQVGKIYASSANGQLAFETGGAERMRIDSNGILLVGTTATSSVTASTANAQYFNQQLRASSTPNTSTVVHNRFYNGNGAVGSIATSGSATAYNTSSDQRLKENIVDAPAGNIDAIRVRSFDWKADGSHQTYGMVAQELVDVAPEAVSQGETDDDMWAVDYSKLVPMMIKEIQDLKAEVAALKGA